MSKGESVIEVVEGSSTDEEVHLLDELVVEVGRGREDKGTGSDMDTDMGIVVVVVVGEDMNDSMMLLQVTS